MSKSLGNIASMQDVLEEWGPEAALVYYLTGHWRSPIDFSEERMREAAARVEGFREVFRNPSQPAEPEAWGRFEAALEDDFNTAEALALMHEWRDHDLVRRALDVFGLERLAQEEAAPAALHRLAHLRQAARSERDFGRADELRAEIEEAGWEVRDDPGGYRLVRKA
jgi:cysteinyl-tRNA synthetase